ncbi:YgiQ family radical SAM protein [Reinekea marinisedimentorum]|uniref:Putative radical SAM protein YgiQ n=1 Tax=Reinekea marinisedimentorum TaxID=230495 RepID=A0A4R3I795_9GAMM|nr:YgiQ family radical SAM protein [Reinekea marinisedimentorum]TCS39969.1 putative radical SAM protein YgiQ [Reinekea marinisedimentorum]
MHKTAPDLFKYPKYWASCFDPAPFLPMTRAEMDKLGWDSCDIILVTGDAYVDHPSFGMAVIGRLLEAQGYRVGIIAQPDWKSADPFKALGKPNLYFGVTAGNMDSLINRYTADLKVRNDDAYTPNNEGGKRPDRAVLVYSQRCKEAYADVPVIIGGIEASLRRIAQYDYWSNKVRHSVLFDANADLLLYGNAERALVEVTHRLANDVPIEQITDVRGTVVMLKDIPERWTVIDSTRIDWPANIGEIAEFERENPYAEMKPECDSEPESEKDDVQAVRIIPMPLQRKAELDGEHTCIRLPSFEKVSSDPALYAHASRILHMEANPHNAHVLVQKHGNQEVWVNPPPIPLLTHEMDGVFDLPYARVPHPSYGKAKIPAYDMIKTSINIMRGCFGGCTFCSITEHEGRVIQSRSHESVLHEVEEMKTKVPGFSGSISDLGGPTANMYHLNCKDKEIQASCRRLSCVYPTICVNLKTDHSETTELYRKVRKVKGIHTVAIASGLRYDLAVEDPEYVKELVTHHVGGYLKIAPEHTEDRPLKMMMKPGMGTYDRFKDMFEKFSKQAGKKQYLIPYFIAAHPGCEDEDMVNLALWLKSQRMKVDQVQTFYPSPMSLATAMYYSGRNPLKKVNYKTGRVSIVKQIEQRQLHKALLRYHDKNNWKDIRAALLKMGLQNLIGDRDNQLVPAEQKGQGRSTGGQKHRAKGFNRAAPVKKKFHAKPKPKPSSKKKK